MRRISTWLIIGPLLVLAAGCCRQGLGTSKPYRPSLSELAGDPGRYAGKLIEVEGQLNNSGANYFTDLQLTLGDGRGNSIRVQPWLPVEVPPARPGGPKNRPALISDYLGKKLKLAGKWAKQEDGFVLLVEKAQPEE